MSDVNRYRPPFMFSTQRPGRMEERTDGNYVTYDDYAALEARLEAMTRERDALIAPEHVQGLVDLAEPMLSDALGAAEDEVARLTAELATARRDALEEAANEVDCGGCVNVGCVDPTNCWHKAAQDIRALIAQEEPTT